MKQNLIVFLIIAGVLFFVAGTYWFLKPNYSYTGELRILKTFELPESLKEVSGISHIDDSKLACIQDEKGSIYIYDLNLESVTREIQFGPRQEEIMKPLELLILQLTSWIVVDNFSESKISNSKVG